MSASSGPEALEGAAEGERTEASGLSRAVAGRGGTCESEEAVMEGWNGTGLKNDDRLDDDVQRDSCKPGRQEQSGPVSG